MNIIKEFGNKKDLIIDFSNDAATLKKLLDILYNNNFYFVSGNYNTTSVEKLREEYQKDFYSFYHGNSHPLIHIFYNNITEKKEIVWATKSVLRTYPQYKTLKIYHYCG